MKLQRFPPPNSNGRPTKKGDPRVRLNLWGEIPPVIDWEKVKRGTFK